MKDMTTRHPTLNLNEIDNIKEEYEKRLNDLLKEFESRVGIVPFQGGLHIKGIKLMVGMGSTRNYFIELEV